ILLTFDRLLPLYACAVADDPLPALARGSTMRGTDFTQADFCRDTYLGREWLERAPSLFGLEREVVLRGVPGTGQTQVDRCRARLLARGQDDVIRLVQFHPAYSYEEFVEGIKVRTVEHDGRQEVTYPVEDGLLCVLAGQAALRPAEPFVLIIDE